VVNAQIDASHDKHESEESEGYQSNRKEGNICKNRFNLEFSLLKSGSNCLGFQDSQQHHLRGWRFWVQELEPSGNEQAWQNVDEKTRLNPAQLWVKPRVDLQTNMKENEKQRRDCSNRVVQLTTLYSLEENSEEGVRKPALYALCLTTQSKYHWWKFVSWSDLPFMILMLAPIRWITNCLTAKCCSQYLHFM
jgi:hypothetical protein